MKVQNKEQVAKLRNSLNGEKVMAASFYGVIVVLGVVQGKAIKCPNLV